jgi:uncharacterized protein
MKMKKEQIGFVCERVLRHLKEKDLIVFKADEQIVKRRMVEEFEKNLQDEADINARARELLKQYAPKIQTGELNESKVLLMIKKELAKERGFIL